MKGRHAQPGTTNRRRWPWVGVGTVLAASCLLAVSYAADNIQRPTVGAVILVVVARLFSGSRA